MTVEIEFPEDSPMEEWIERMMAKSVNPDPFGRSETDKRLELATYWIKRKRTFAEDLADIRNEVISMQNPDRDVFSKADMKKALDTAMVTVHGLVKGYCPGTDKYVLQRYVCQLEKDEKGQMYLAENATPIESSIEQYFKAVNN